MVFDFGFMGCYGFFQIFAVDFLSISNGDWGIVYAFSLIVYLGTIMQIGVLVESWKKKVGAFPHWHCVFFKFSLSQCMHACRSKLITSTK